VETDPEFAELVDEIHLHKKDFFESKLVELVQSGDSSATIFANKTMNRDRGYGDKTTIEHTGTVVVEQRVVQIGDLALPVDVRRAILGAVRAHLAATNTPGLPGEVVHDPRIVDALPAPPT
jgi:hypothetical protein